MTDLAKHPNIANMLEKIEQDEQAESLEYLIDKLPELATSVQMIEEKVSFAVAALSDQQSLRSTVNDIEKKVERLRINEEHLNAMIELVHMLPRFVPVIDQLDRLMSFAQDVIEDERTTQSLIDGINDVVPIQQGTEIIEKTNEHFQHNKDTAPISIFGLMRMLKDPTVQHSLKYMQSLLHVVGEESIE